MPNPESNWCSQLPQVGKFNYASRRSVPEQPEPPLFPPQYGTTHEERRGGNPRVSATSVGGAKQGHADGHAGQQHGRQRVVDFLSGRCHYRESLAEKQGSGRCERRGARRVEMQKPTLAFRWSKTDLKGSSSCFMQRHALHCASGLERHCGNPQFS